MGGLVVGLLPCIYFFVRDPRRFLSDSFFSQTSRSNLSLLDALVQKLRTADTLLGGAQFLILVGAAVLLAAFLMLTRRRVPLAVAIAGLLGLVSLVPTPTYDQYFCTLVPFLAVGTIELWQVMRDAVPRSPGGRRAFAVRAVAIGCLLLFVIAGADAYDHIMNSGDLLLDMPKERVISKAIDAHTHDGEVVIDFAPIDLYESHAKPLPGLESNFGTFVATNRKFSDAEAKRDKLLTVATIEKTIRSKTVRTLVLTPYDSLLFPGPWKQIATEAGYRPVATVGPSTIYQLPT